MKEGKDISSLEEKLLGEDTGKTRFTIDRLLEKWVGEFGRWQLKHFLLVSFAWTLEAMQTMVMIFADHEPDWRCKSNNPLHGSKIFTESGEWLGFDPCSPASSICSMDRSLWEWTRGSSVSTVSEWGLFCAQKYKVGLAQSAFFIGCLIGAGVFGHLSDSSLGRKGVLRLVCILNAIFGFMTAMSPNFWIYSLLRLLTGVSTGGVGLSSFVLATEPVGPSKRGPVGMSAFYFFSLGITILPLLSYFFTTWRLLYVVSSIPSLLYVLLVLPFISESPRWYLVKGRTEEAMAVMRSMAFHNGNILPVNVSLALEEENEQSDVDPFQEVSGSPVDIFRSPVTRTRMVFMLFIWLSCALVYYGLSLNVVNLKTSLHVSVFLNGICEMPAFAITATLLQKLGRRVMLVSTMLLSGFCAVAGSLISSGQGIATHKFLGILQLGCSMLGIFGMAGTYNLLYIYTAELFPTVVRNAALGMASVTGNMGAIFAPLVIVLATVNPGLPFGVIGACGVAGGIVAIKLPETLNQPLYETMTGLEWGETRGKCDS
ncbi:hypothetical protein SUGI_0646430 [Cryptomeria japonica]|uniref:organic cation/carnitine transporter 4 n=1 Tax=Cryptomeria japonica TaxID=3369 RepID=UPI002414B458|nr:organic cation/carnitine transporter 4 [Cryptomeria japonica]GLJ32100.1 hypothetical protein SUGI_0646430 [Cryptomeria japonica]